MASRSSETFGSDELYANDHLERKLACHCSIRLKWGLSGKNQQTQFHYSISK